MATQGFGAIAARYERFFPGDRAYSSYPDEKPRTSRHVFRSDDSAEQVIIGEATAIVYMTQRLALAQRCRIDWRNDETILSGPASEHRANGAEVWWDTILVVALKRTAPHRWEYVASDFDALLADTGGWFANPDEAIAMVSRDSGTLFCRRARES